ncbi:SRPBCC family protein [Oceanobacillus sojae]|uniref:ATPase n=1 Tax=Oceanobacillus sojae TaxID=582851 RepID=A0A511ZQC4_9BACI|nr:SRPBCC domain-containing protein [Oceanobacillus sojae]GEN89653.1 ATPase [Oceanobacillus sojae]
MRNLSIEKQREISAATETVWNVLTNPDFIKQWLGVTVNTDWNVGCSITFSFTWDGTEYEDKGHILEYEPQSVFSYDYWSGFSGTPDSPENYSIITFNLSNNSKHTTLRLKHSNFATPTMYEHSDKNWEETIEVIKKLAEESKG